MVGLRPLLALACAIALSQGAAAQAVVRTESHGVPIGDVEVAAWGDSGRIALARTDAAGLATLRLRRGGQQSITVTARRLGFAPGRAALTSADTVVIEMTPRAAALAAVAVRARQWKCPRTPDAAALARWRAVSARYFDGQPYLHFGYLGSWSHEQVPREQLGGGDSPDELRLGFFAPTLPFGLPVPPLDYASFEHLRSSSGLEYDHWRYAQLQGLAAWYFVNPNFGVRHTFSVLDSSPDGSVVLGFCGLDASANVEGELEIAADSRLLAARWSFRVPHDDEAAGGRATFGVSHYAGQLLLVSLEGATWRRIRGDRFEQDRHELRAWRFGRSREDVATGWDARGDVSDSLITAPAR